MKTRPVIGGGVGLVDSAREKNKARAVLEIYHIHLNRGRYRGLLHPFDFDFRLVGLAWDNAGN